MVAIFAVRFIYCLRRFEGWPLNLERQVHTHFGSRQMRSVSYTVVWISFSPANLKSFIPSKSPEAWAISDQAARWVSWRLHIWHCAWLFTRKGCWLLLVSMLTNKFVLKPLISRYWRTIWTIYVNLLLSGPLVLRFVLAL